MKRATVRELKLQDQRRGSGVPVAEQRRLEKAPTRRLPNREAIITKLPGVEDSGHTLAEDRS